MKMALMIPPLIIGFMCLFASALGSGSMQHQYTTNSQGEPNLGVPSTIALNNSLIVSQNGLTSGGWFGSYVSNNNQTGNTSYRVYNIVTTYMQMWRYAIPNGTADVTCIYDHSSGYGSIEFMGPSKTITEPLSQWISAINNNMVNKTLDLGFVPNMGGGSHKFFYELYVIPFNGTLLYTDLSQGYGFIVAISAQSISTTGSFGDILGGDGMVIILITALAISGVAAITVFGSGVSFFGQKIIFTSATFIVLWVFLSIGMYSMVLSIPVIGIIIWLVLTGMYLLGVADIVLGGGDSVG
jgi:hypothetical protein